MFCNACLSCNQYDIGFYLNKKKGSALRVHNCNQAETGYIAHESFRVTIYVYPQKTRISIDSENQIIYRKAQTSNREI